MENCLPEAKFFHAMFVQKIPGNSPLCVRTTWTTVAGIFDHRRASSTLKGDENFKWKEIRLSIKAQLERYFGRGETGAAATRAQHVTENFTLIFIYGKLNGEKRKQVFVLHIFKYANAWCRHFEANFPTRILELFMVSLVSRDAPRSSLRLPFYDVLRAQRNSGKMFSCDYNFKVTSTTTTPTNVMEMAQKSIGPRKRCHYAMARWKAAIRNLFVFHW